MAHTLYDTIGRLQVLDQPSLQRHLVGRTGAFYVYVLCHPPIASQVTPFYVGIGRGDRLFAHERDADNPSSEGRKVDAIRQIRRSGCDVLRFLDGLFEDVPWKREQELIACFGLQKDGSGILTNEQRYSDSFEVDGIELRKYAADGNELPNNFVRRGTRLLIGPRRPRSASSVYGKIYATLEQHPGVTGAELVELLLRVDFSNNNTIYAQSGQVSRPWLAKYVDGGFYDKNRYVQELPQNSGEAGV